MSCSENFSRAGVAVGNPGVHLASPAAAPVLPRVRQLCPAGVTPGAPWHNGVVPLVAYIVYTPTHALAASAGSLPALP